MKKRLLIVAKVLVSLGLIVWLLRRSDLDAIWRTLAGADIGRLAAAFLVFFLVYWLIAARWRLLLAAQKVPASTVYLVNSFAISIFFNNFLPSIVGGDLYRMYDSWRLGARRSVAVSVVLVDRVTGLFALLCYAFVASFYAAPLVARVPSLQWLLLLAVGAIAIAGWLIFAPAGRRLESLLGNRHPLLRRPLGLLEKIVSSFALFSGRHDVLLRALGLSLLAHLTSIVVHMLLLNALGIQAPLHSMFIVVPLAFLLMMVPVSINGIGLREAVFVFLLSAFGVGAEQAIAFAWASFGLTLAQGVVGGVVFLLRRPEYRDIRDESDAA